MDVRGRGSTRDEVVDGVNPEADRGECWAQFIVEVAAQSPSLLFLGRDQPGSRAVDLDGQGDSLNGQRDVHGELREHLAVGPRQWFAVAATAHDERADRCSLAGQRHLEERSEG